MFGIVVKTTLPDASVIIVTLTPRRSEGMAPRLLAAVARTPSSEVVLAESLMVIKLD